MAKVKIEIKGTTPLLMNRFSEENEVKLASGTSPAGNAGRGTPREQAEKTAYKDTKGFLFVPGPNIYRSIIDAGKFHKYGKSKVTTQRNSLVTAGVSLDAIVVPLGVKDFEVDSRSVVIPATGGRVMRHRARLDEWKLAFELEVDTQVFDVDFVRTLVDDAGKKIGLGDFRPDRKGPFGKFKVTTWKVSSNGD